MNASDLVKTLFCCKAINDDVRIDFTNTKMKITSFNTQIQSIVLKANIAYEPENFEHEITVYFKAELLYNILQSNQKNMITIKEKDEDKCTIDCGTIPFSCKRDIWSIPKVETEIDASTIQFKPEMSLKTPVSFLLDVVKRAKFSNIKCTAIIVNISVTEHDFEDEVHFEFKIEGENGDTGKLPLSWTVDKGTRHLEVTDDMSMKKRKIFQGGKSIIQKEISYATKSLDIASSLPSPNSHVLLEIGSNGFARIRYLLNEEDLSKADFYIPPKLD